MATPSPRPSRHSAISARPRPRSMICATCSRSMSRKAAISGRWSICCRNTLVATGARKPTSCCAAAPAMRIAHACSAPSTRRRRTGCRSSCSPTLPTATARCSCPHSRRCPFRLTEEAQHMFGGETGISRVVQRTCEAMKQAGISDPTDIAKVRALGAIDLPTIQKKLNLHYSLSLDLFGSEVSTNAANAFNAGIKGRYKETQIHDDHQLKNSTYPVLKLVNGEIKRVDEPALTALNMRLRDDYTQDCAKGMLRWNKIISLAGYDFKLTLPNVAFHRQIGEFKDIHATPDGVLIDDATWKSRKGEWLPSTADGDFIASLMTPVTEVGAFAPWIWPPQVGDDNKPGDFEYVKIET